MWHRDLSHLKALPVGEERNESVKASSQDKVLALIDRRTGGQGAPAVDTNIARAILRDTILNLSRGFAGNKPVHGLNDNSVFDKSKFGWFVFYQAFVTDG